MRKIRPVVDHLFDGGQGRRAAKFKIHNSINPDEIDKEEHADIGLCHSPVQSTHVSSLCHCRDQRDDATLSNPRVISSGLVGDARLTIEALIAEIKVQTGGRGAGNRPAVEVIARQRNRRDGMCADKTGLHRVFGAADRSPQAAALTHCLLPDLLLA